MAIKMPTIINVLLKYCMALFLGKFYGRIPIQFTDFQRAEDPHTFTQSPSPLGPPPITRLSFLLTGPLYWEGVYIKQWSCIRPLFLWGNEKSWHWIAGWVRDHCLIKTSSHCDCAVGQNGVFRTSVLVICGSPSSGPPSNNTFTTCPVNKSCKFFFMGQPFKRPWILLPWFFFIVNLFPKCIIKQLSRKSSLKFRIISQL